MDRPRPSSSISVVLTSCVVNPDLDPSDTYVLGLLDPDPLVRGMDPDPSPSKNSTKNPDSYCFVTPF
jgi:hypothetical protein